MKDTKGKQDGSDVIVNRMMPIIATVVREQRQLHGDMGAADGNAPASDNMTLEFPFSSEEPVLRQRWCDDEPWLEVLGHNDGEVDLSRFIDGASVMLNHGMGNHEGMLPSVGITTGASIRDGKGYVSVKLSRRDGMGGLLMDIGDGIVRNVSAGYRILERKLIRQEQGKPAEYRVTKWIPVEVSFVDIPADSTVGVGRNEKSLFPALAGAESVKDTTLTRGGEVASENAAESGGKENPAQTVNRADIAAEERKLAADILYAVRQAGMDENVADDMIRSGASLDAVKGALLDKLVERTKAQGASAKDNISVTRDETETRRSMLSNAIMNRADASVALDSAARQYRGLTMLDIARECVEKTGTDTRGMDRMSIATRAFQGTSDLPNILANVASSTLARAYDTAAQTFTPWARRTTAPDFKDINRVSLSDAPALETVNESGEFKRGFITDGKETYRLVTVGKLLAVSRQAIINDDLNAFTRLPALFAASARNYESDTVYGILTANAALSDGKALFHADHANLTSTGTAISVTSLGVARKSMRTQTTPKGVVMNLQPQFMIVPAALETIALQFNSQAYVAAQSSNINPFAGQLQVISEGRLDANSATAWYLAASNSVIDTVEYCYLEGQSGPYLETQNGFEVDGMRIKVRLDFAAKAVEYRGIYKNVGA